MKKEIMIGAEYADMRVDRFVGKAFPELARGKIQKMLREGDVRLNKKKVTGETRLVDGDILSVYAPSAESGVRPPIKKLPALPVIYEDEQLLAVIKPAGLLTHPDGKRNDSVSERILSYLYGELDTAPMFQAAPVNRLDFNTSGIVIAGKTPQYAKALAELVRKNKIKKRYLVLVGGELREKLSYTCYAEKDERENKMILYDEPSAGRVEMKSVFTPLEYKNNMTLISAILITGRTHQLRAQLAYLGYPVVGDRKYGDIRLNFEAEKRHLSRQFLHCCELCIPTDFDTIRLICAPSRDLSDYLANIGFSFSMEHINESEE